MAHSLAEGKKRNVTKRPLLGCRAAILDGRVWCSASMVEEGNSS